MCVCVSVYTHVHIFLSRSPSFLLGRHRLLAPASCSKLRRLSHQNLRGMALVDFCSFGVFGLSLTSRHLQPKASTPNNKTLEPLS